MWVLRPSGWSSGWPPGAFVALPGHDHTYNAKKQLAKEQIRSQNCPSPNSYHPVFPWPFLSEPRTEEKAHVWSGERGLKLRDDPPATGSALHCSR